MLNDQTAASRFAGRNGTTHCNAFGPPVEHAKATNFLAVPQSGFLECLEVSPCNAFP